MIRDEAEAGGQLRLCQKIALTSSRFGGKCDRKSLAINGLRQIYRKIPPHPGWTVFDPTARTRRELAEVRPLSPLRCKDTGRGEQERVFWGGPKKTPLGMPSGPGGRRCLRRDAREGESTQGICASCLASSRSSFRLLPDAGRRTADARLFWPGPQKSRPFLAPQKSQKSPPGDEKSRPQAPQAGLNTSTESGGSVSTRLWAWPWKGMGSVKTAPALPTLPPP
jgi:hypothetical protein